VQAVMLPGTEGYVDEYKKFWTGKVDEVGFLDYKQMDKRNKGIEYPWACPQIWQRMAVWWDGTILPCNHDDDGSLSLGEVGKVPIKAAWHSEKLKHVRKMHKIGKAHEIKACDGCYLRDSEISKLQQSK